MALTPDPCFIETIKRASGSVRTLVYVTNANPTALDLLISTTSKPEWIDVEGAMMGDTLHFNKGGKLPLVLNINTDHRFFPTESNVKEEIKFEFEGNVEPLSIYIYLQEIISEVSNYRGTFSIDFGTTNSCYAWKGRVGDDYQMSDAFMPPKVSREVPSVIRFKNISNKELPEITIGNEARDYISHNSGRNFTYQLSIKRLLGSEKKVTILDDMSGLEADRYQLYAPEEIAGFVIKELLIQAEREIGEKIETIVATYPILYNKKKLEALKAAFKLAYEGMNREWNDDRLVLKVDETNAASFNYIYTNLLGEFRRFNVESKEYRLLSYDFGGGTVDVALTDINLSRDDSGRLKIDTIAKGLTGDAYFGGDNITLAVLKIIKYKLLARIAERKIAMIEERRNADAAAALASAAADDPWALADTPTEATKSDDPWGSLADDDSAGAEEVVEEAGEEESPEVADIQNFNQEATIDNAIETLSKHKDVFEMAATWGVTPMAALERMVQNGVKEGVQGFEVASVGNAIEDSMNVILPTAWTELEKKGDLIAKDTARKLFYELWIPAEVMKIRAVSSDDRVAKFTEPLPQIAKYAGVRPEDLMGIEVSEKEINEAIRIPLKKSISKAAYLKTSCDDGKNQGGGGLDFGIEEIQEADGRPFTVLLAGNSSRLPIVKEMVAEVFDIDSSAVVMDPKGVKATTAQGACEEHILFRDFGEEGGLIEYGSTDFVDRIPYSVGLFHKELSLLGYKGGFAPVMERGSDVINQVLLTDSLQILNTTTTELSIFSYYHDHELGNDASAEGTIEGVQPTNLGWFDLRSPQTTGWDKPLTEQVQAQVDAAPEGTFLRVLDMDNEQNLTIINPETKEFYPLIKVPERCDDNENPFSGTH